MSHKRSHVVRANASAIVPPLESDPCHIWMSHVTYEGVMAHMSHVTHEWVMSHMKKSCHIWVTSHMPHACETWLLQIWLDSLICDMTHSYVTWLIPVWHDSLLCDTSPACVTWLFFVWHDFLVMAWLWLVGSIKLLVSFAKEPYKKGAILQKRPIISSILLTAATPQWWALKACRLTWGGQAKFSKKKNSANRIW